MKPFVVQVLKLIAITLAGGAGATIVGLLVYGSDVFSLSSPGFSFVSFGLSGALIFAFYHVRGLSEAITAAVVASAVQFAVGTAYVTLLWAVLFSFGLNVPVILLAFIFERKLASVRYIRFAVVSVTYGAMFVALTFLVRALSGSGGVPAIVFRENFVDGLLLGLGLGLGVQGGEALLHSIEHPAPSKTP